MTAIPIDLNADMGEGFGVWQLGNDEGLLEVVTSANVACGFHGGDPVRIRRVCHGAATHGVVVGAQVSYRDLAGFGRRRIDYQPQELTDEVIYQIGALDGLCRVAGTRVRYVKPHGALYHSCVEDEVQAAAVVRAVHEYNPDLPVLGPPGSALLRLATEMGLSAVPEGFADRGYRSNGSLVPRTDMGAVLYDADLVTERAVRMVRHRQIEAVDGTTVPLDVRSLCVHGDTPHAVTLATRIREALLNEGFVLEPFV